MTELRDTTGETAQLWIRRGDERICKESPGLDFGTAVMQAAHRIEAGLAQAQER